MIYRLTNIENDDFVASLLEELEYELRNGEYEKIRLSETVRSNSNTKGIEIQELIIHIGNLVSENEQFLENILNGIIAAELYDILKKVVRRLRKIPEYGPEKKIEFIQEDSEGNKQKLVITMQEILEKDKK